MCVCVWSAYLTHYCRYLHLIVYVASIIGSPTEWSLRMRLDTYTLMQILSTAYHIQVQTLVIKLLL